jgi:REP element-mobilizing transposase RayT
MQNSTKTPRDKFQVLSPDGFQIERDKAYYRTFNEAVDAFLIWKERFRVQGYYSSNSGRITLNELKDYCQFNIV